MARLSRRAEPRVRTCARQRTGINRDPATRPIARHRFSALADPTRRRVLERLALRPCSVTELAVPFEMALPSFVQHLRVLEECGLVRSSKDGRVRTYRLDPEGFRGAEDWLEGQRQTWERRLDQLDSYLIQMKETRHD
ncbi:MAG TPA: metalloregulator ArsR/SmtB family transcription factor [Tepidiformaceae bacterium]|nr:metalloregulator ArsR/SmtB family transcription factor [Tepidiformaceae bacterium]